MPNLMADLSDYQTSTEAFMQALKDQGVKAVVILSLIHI